MPILDAQEPSPAPEPSPSKRVPIFLRLFHTGINDHNLSGTRAPRIITRFLWSRPEIYRIYLRRRHGTNLFNPDLQLVIDGFPRSGNSYSGRMIGLSQGENFKFLSQCHCPPFLLAALKMGTPAALTLRQPEDSAVSWVILRKLPMDVVLKLYIDFHRVLLRQRKKLLVLNFKTITGDFSLVLRMMNRRFGLKLDVPENIHATKEEAFSHIDSYYQQQPGGYDPMKVARPHPERDQMKEQVRQQLKSPQNARIVAEALKLYEAFDFEGRQELAKLSGPVA